MRRFAILSLAFLPAQLAAGVLAADGYPASGCAAQSFQRLKPTSIYIPRGRGSFATAWRLAVCAAILSTAMDVDRACAQTKYRFVNIVDSDGPLRYFGREISINNHGVIAFLATDDDSNARGIFIGTGGPTSTIAHTSGPYSSLDIFGGVDINDDRAVAFLADLDAGGGGVFTSDGATTTTIALAGRAAPFRGLVGKPAINHSGTVAFWGRRPESGWAVFIGGGGEPILAASGSPGLGSVSISDDGFASFIDGRRIAKADGGTVSTIVESGAHVDFGPLSVPISHFYTHSTNSSGTTAFVANVATERGIYTVKDGIVTRVTDHLNPVIPSSDSVAINDAGTVVFFGSPRGDLTRGIYTGGDPITNRVIGIGDPLFGSTLRSLLSSASIDVNDRGDIAFHYLLSNGVYGIAVASPVPEPAGAGLSLIALIALLRLHPASMRG